MKVSKVIYIFWVLLFGACKEEDLAPITGMIVSVPKLGIIDENGAEFSAEIKSLGPDLILEYGFVYGFSSRPDISSDPKISIQSSPPQSFSLKAEKDLIQGRNYYVSSFLRTQKTVFYSESIGFRSKGSKNFILQKITSNPEVYFGDTITIEAANLKESTGFLMKVKFEDVEVPFFDYSESGFKFIIPKIFSYRNAAFELGAFNLNIVIQDNAYDLILPLKFRKPIFTTKKEVEYASEWTFTGDFLFSSNVNIYLVQAGKETRLNVLGVDDQNIIFDPNTFFLDKNPLFRIELRQQFYEVRPFEIADTDLLPGQDFLNDRNMGGFVAKVKNLNPIYSSIPPLLSSEPSIRLNFGNISDSEVEFSVSPNGALQNREFRVFANNFGENSTNSAPVKYSLPMFPAYDLPQSLRSSNTKYGVTLSGKGYFYSDNTMYLFNPAVGSVVNLASLSGSTGKDGFLVGFGDKIYVSTFDEFPYQNSTSFYEFDPASNQFKPLSPIPTNGEVLGQFVSNGKLILDLKLVINSAYDIRRFFYDFATNTWSQSAQNSSPNFFSKYSTFQYRDQTLALGQGKLDSQGYDYGIFKWNESTLDWEFVKRIDGLTRFPSGANVLLKGDLAYFQFETQTFEFDIKNAELTRQTYFGFLFTKSFLLINGRMYILGSQDWPFVFEFDPEYL
jgi:hypothetical protein